MSPVNYRAYAVYDDNAIYFLQASKMRPTDRLSNDINARMIGRWRGQFVPISLRSSQLYVRKILRGGPINKTIT